MSMDTDPHPQAAVSPQIFVRRSSSRYSAKPWDLDDCCLGVLAVGFPPLSHHCQAIVERRWPSIRVNDGSMSALRRR